MHRSLADGESLWSLDAIYAIPWLLIPRLFVSSIHSSSVYNLDLTSLNVPFPFPEAKSQEVEHGMHGWRDVERIFFLRIEDFINCAVVRGRPSVRFSFHLLLSPIIPPLHQKIELFLKRKQNEYI
jgi:hypothetical protein